jgi:cell fate regulator YaaT (PSP1 superfamily)
MNKFLVKIRPWENFCVVESELILQRGDILIVETEDGLESAIVEEAMSPKEISSGTYAGLREGGFKMVRKANLRDLNTIKEFQKKEAEAFKICRDEVKKSGLPMKIVNCRYSFDGESITFAFIAEGRVDFRSLVRNLSRIFQRSVKLYQIGARDEVRQEGGYGICGKELCCIRFRGNLPSISSEMAKAQQIIRRGSERISGVCGRLMCCLAYEADQYQKILEKMPPVGSEVKIKGEKGIVRDANALTGELKIELSSGNIAKVRPEDLI